MCLMLYVATRDELPLRSSPELSVEDVAPHRTAVRQWFSLPVVRFVGAHTRCSCGFPSVIADVPIEYFDGMLDDAPDREADLRSVDALLALVREHAAGGEVQLYAVGDGDEGSPPKGVINVGLGSLQPRTFFFNEQFLYRVTPDADSTCSSSTGR
jgi:hypothetical protein